jgi:hypothetical protein
MPVLLNVRIPKSGSESVSQMLRDALPRERQFYLPNTMDLDGRVSAFQRSRFLRRQRRNLVRAYRTASLGKALEIVAASISGGDVIDGGHIDFRSIAAAMMKPLQMIVLLRDPASRNLSEYNYARQVYLVRNPIRRLTAAMLPKICGTRDFDGYLDFVADNQSVYGDVAAQYMGWDGAEDLAAFFSRNVFQAGMLEQNEKFADALSCKLGRQFRFPAVNRTAWRSAESITRAQHSKIEKINPRDCALYDWVQANW